MVNRCPGIVRFASYRAALHATGKRNVRRGGDSFSVLDLTNNAIAELLLPARPSNQAGLVAARLQAPGHAKQQAIPVSLLSV